MLEVINQLEATKSTKEKANILEQHISNKDLFHFFNYSLNPYLKFNIRKVPKYVHKEVKYELQDAYILLDKLNTREVSGNKAKEEVLDMFEHLSKSNAELFKRMLTKTAGCGVSIKTYNKVAGKNSIPLFGCMLYEKYTQEREKNLRPPYVTQLKSDGARAEALITDKVQYMTRKGNEYIMYVPEIDKWLMAVRELTGIDLMIDGEMVAVDEYGEVKREKSNGLVNKAIAGTLSDKEADSLKFVIWDIVPLESFYEGEYNVGYYKRYELLKDIVQRVGAHPKVELSETNIYDSLEDALAKADEYIAAGKEGALIKSFDSIWEDKRVNNSLKVKAEDDCDLIAIGYSHGDPNKGLDEGIGSIIFATSCRQLQVSVSSGLSMEQRGYIKDENDNYVFDKTFDLNKYNNKIGKISYASLTQSSKTGAYSLFTPVLVEFRDDKDEADTLERIGEQK